MSHAGWRMLARRSALVALLVLSRPALGLACAVCFGKLDGPLAEATNQAVFAMLGVTIGVLGSFAGFFVYLARRTQAFAEVPDGVPAASDGGSESAGRP